MKILNAKSYSNMVAENIALSFNQISNLWFTLAEVQGIADGECSSMRGTIHR